MKFCDNLNTFQHSETLGTLLSIPWKNPAMVKVSIVFIPLILKLHSHFILTFINHMKIKELILKYNDDRIYEVALSYIIWGCFCYFSIYCYFERNYIWNFKKSVLWGILVLTLFPLFLKAITVKTTLYLLLPRVSW